MYLVFLCLFLTFSYILARYETSRERQKMLTLLINHPELEAEIIGVWEKFESYRIGEAQSEEKLSSAADILQNRYGYDIEKISSKKIYFVFGGIGAVISAVITGYIACAEMQQRKRNSGSRQMLRNLEEYLSRLQKGGFRQIPDYEKAPEDWMKVWESVRELDIYFEHLKKRLEEEEKSTKALITDISHQLKTPFASLRMCHELVMSEKISAEEKKEFQEQELREIGKLELLISELVNLSRLEKHMIELHPVPSGVRETIAEAVSRVYLKARKKEMELQVEMEEDFTVVHDVKWTVEALVNVLDNAVKYSDLRSTVTVRVCELVKNVLIEVKDEGIGIPTDELVKIYHRFYRGSEAKKQVKEGAGVGLYLSRMILEREGGTISAKRGKEKGTVFQITLPFVKG